MKKLLLALGLIPAMSFASVQFYNSSNTNLGIQSKVKCGSDLSCSKTSGKLAIGLSGIHTQTAGSTSSLTSTACGTSIVSDSADVVTLPEASTVLGCRITFVCGTADDFDVNPADASDQILSISTTNGTTAVVTLAPSAGDAIRCTDIGGSITLEATGVNAWAQVGGGNGVWSDVN